MTNSPDDAKLTVQLHAGHVEIGEYRSIVGQLRPFSGILEDDFQDLYSALITLHGSLVSDELDRELVYACWDLCNRIRILTPTLVSNHIIDDQELKRLTLWERSIESYCMRCFHQLTLLECMSTFLEYLASDSCYSPELYRGLLPMLKEFRGEADFEMGPILEAAIKAIAA